VIADIDGDDDSFLRKTARRGILAYVKHGEQPGMEHAIDIVLSRYAEFNCLHGALRTAAIIEQAKGILTERHGITADQAFAELRSRARNTNKTVVDVAQAVTLSYPLFKFDRGPQAADLGRAVVLADDRFDRGDGPEPACAWATKRIPGRASC
jgi:ANTAR domain